MPCGYVEVYFAAMTRRWRGGVARRRRRGRARWRLSRARDTADASLRVTPRRVRSVAVPAQCCSARRRPRVYHSLEGCYREMWSYD